MVLPAISRRLFMKGIGALAGSTALPKGIASLATKEAVKKIPYAPPWVGSFVNMFYRIPLIGKPVRVGNGAIATKLG